MAHDSLRREDSYRTPAVRRCATFVLVTFAFAGFASLAVPPVASAQQYQADDVDEAAGKLKLTAEQAVKNPGRFAADRARFNEFFEKYYFPAMTRNEAILIKCYDSEKDGRARFSLHSAFEDPTSPPNARPRESIEVRAFAFWD